MTFEFGMTEPTPTYRTLKRAVDVAVAIIGFALMALPMLAIVLAVLVSGTPVLFRQTRIGEGGRPFTMYKSARRRAIRMNPGPLDLRGYLAMRPTRWAHAARASVRTRRVGTRATPSADASI